MSEHKDLLSMLEGMESALVEMENVPVKMENVPVQMESVRVQMESVRVQMDVPVQMEVPGTPRPVMESGVLPAYTTYSPRLDADPLPIERVQHVDPPVRYTGFPPARERTCVALAAFRWDEPGTSP